MRNNFLKKYFLTAKNVSENRALKPIQHLLQKNHLFHLNRRSAARAVFIGLFCSFIPLPSQMMIAAVLCWAFRCNVPLGVSLVWISNPITMGPIFYFTYKLGTGVLGTDIQTTDTEFSFGWLWDNLVGIGYPLLIGSFICGWVSGITGFVSVHFAWRIYVLRSWRRRRSSENN